MIPVKASERARASVLEAVLYGEHPAVLVDSPPGAGKTELVEEVVATAVAHRHWRVAVIAPRAEQTYDIVRRLRADYKPMRMEVLHSAERRPPNDLITSGMNFVTTASRLTSGPGLVIATAAKLFHSVPDFSSGVFDLLVCDEAYQLPYKDLAPMVHLAKRILLVGDPGQLPPLIRADVARFEAAKYKVHWPAPKEFLRCHPNLKRIALPCSWRLTQDTVNFLQPTFYENLPFVSGVSAANRRISFSTSGLGDPIDQALDRLSSGDSIVGILLPPRKTDVDEVDEDIAQLAGWVIDRLIKRGVQWTGQRQLLAADVGYVDSHVASNAAAGRALRAKGIGNDTMANTPEIWQGLQRPIMVTKHTLSGSPRLDSFSLEPGRLCVMLSRHQLACIIIARDGIGDALENHQHDCASRPAGVDNAEWLGWQAHRSLWSMLEEKNRLVRLSSL
jgi:AAA domain